MTCYSADTGIGRLITQEDANFCVSVTEILIVVFRFVTDIILKRGKILMNHSVALYICCLLCVNSEDRMWPTMNHVLRVFNRLWVNLKLISILFIPLYSTNQRNAQYYNLMFNFNFWCLFHVSKIFDSYAVWCVLCAEITIKGFISHLRIKCWSFYMYYKIY